MSTSKPHRTPACSDHGSPAASATPSFAEFDRRARAGERLTVVFMGGSLTWGAGATDPQRTSYRALLGRRLAETYPEARFTCIDAAIGGSGAQLAAFRLQRDVLAFAPDLVFLDFTLNDGIYDTTPDTLAAYEAIVRRIIGEGNCPLVLMILAARQFVTEGTTERMKRRDAHLALAAAYQTAVGDAVALMQAKHQRGEIDLDQIWPPELFDMTHPDNPGYALYAEAGWNAYRDAVASGLVCTTPPQTLNSDHYLRWARVPLAALTPLPAGWRVARPLRGAVAFDFVMSRWLDNVTIAANFVEPTRQELRITEPPAPLCVRFSGSTVLFFGESTPRCCRYRVLIDGQPATRTVNGEIVPEFDAAHLGKACQGNAHLWTVIAEGLDPAMDHTLEIQPIVAADAPGELRLESICVAGGQAKVWR